MRRFVIYARVGAGVMLIVCWGLVDSPLSGVAWLLALIALSAVRYRLAPYKWLIAAETAICIGYAFLWLPSLLGLWIPVIGLLEIRWETEEKELLLKAIEDRGERLKLQSSVDAAARETQNAARLAEMAERSRIAQDIHDSVGHEISGASIALQTAIRLYERNDERAGELLEQSAKRLEKASEHLREAVHNLKPSRVVGVGTLHDLCDDFDFCEIRFETSGDFSGVLHWRLLAANLKETLTNITRHSEATLVTVRLDANADYIRMQVSDNGQTRQAAQGKAAQGKTEQGKTTQGKTAPGSQTLLAAGKKSLSAGQYPLADPALNIGLGLTGMRERVRAAGGTLTISADNGFTVVTVLPRS